MWKIMNGKKEMWLPDKKCFIDGGIFGLKVAIDMSMMS